MLDFFMADQLCSQVGLIIIQASLLADQMSISCLNGSFLILFLSFNRCRCSGTLSMWLVTI